EPPKIQAVLRGVYAGGDIQRAVELLQLEQDSKEGIVLPVRWDVKLQGAVNRHKSMIQHSPCDLCHLLKELQLHAISILYYLPCLRGWILLRRYYTTCSRMRNGKSSRRF